MKANDIRVGNIIMHNKMLYKVISFEKVKPGKGGAYVQTEFVSILNGTKHKHRFGSAENVEKIFTKRINCTFLYKTKNTVHLLGEEDSLEVNINTFSGKSAMFLEDEMQIECICYNNQILECKIPDRIKVKIKFCDMPTNTASFKDATLYNDYKIKVPDHIKEQDAVIIETENFTYVGK